MENDAKTEASFPDDELPESSPIPSKNSSTRWFRILTIVLLVCLLGGGLFAIQKLSTPQTPSSTFTTFNQHGLCVVSGASFNLNQGIPTLGAIAAISAENAWTVGSFANATLIEHWDGVHWSVVPSPNPDPIGNRLEGITALSANDIWAVGSSLLEWPPQRPNNPGVHTLIEHWDGHQWRVVLSPDGGGFNNLSAVAADSADDVWAVGYIAHTFTSFDDPAYTPRLLVEHWNGHQWSIVPELTN